MAIARRLLLRLTPAKQKEPATAIPPDLPVEPTGRAPDVEWGSITDMYLYEKNNSAAKNGRRAGVFHPSEGLLPETQGCVRRTVLDLICAPKSDQSFDAGLCRIFEHGHHVQDKIDRWFEDMAKSRFMGIARYEHHLKLEHPTIPISGEADCIVTMQSGHRYLNDAKTYNKERFKALTGPSPAYTGQLNMYMGLAGVSQGYIWPENKDNQRWPRSSAPFRLDFDLQLFRQQEDYCLEILGGVNRGELPPFDAHVCDRDGCSYAEACDAERAGQETFESLDHREPGQVTAMREARRLPVVKGGRK